VPLCASRAHPLYSDTEVNAGPLEICRLFLSEEKRKEYPEQHVIELDAAMKEFFKLCGFALVHRPSPLLMASQPALLSNGN
jgi:hypothetical protein